MSATAGAALAATLAGPVLARNQPDPFSLARITYVEKEVERGGTTWEEAVEGGDFDVGGRLRTGPGGLARLDLPWMAISLGPGSEVRIPDTHLLSIVLERGRATLEARTQATLKLVTPEAEVRGQGRAVVRREGQRTLVTCVEGLFEVQGGGRGVSLSAGRGAVVRSGGSPSEASETAPPPVGLWPGRDPVFAARGEPLDLDWEAEAPTFHVEVLPVGTDYVLLQKDVGPPPVQMSIPWGGAFRWRVAARDDRGLEGVPSAEGLICVDLVE